ncbi:MAG: hypothetical protein HQL15_09555, partial [Candidatus Omnitrophica bacterium]|nr:hypothetical protein [Candidatus Omnitrophota bacterium]
MFFRKFACLNVFLSILIVSSPIYASELAGGYLYLPKAVFFSSPLQLPLSVTERNLSLIDYSKAMSVRLELDRLEALEHVHNSVQKQVQVSAPVETPLKKITVSKPSVSPTISKTITTPNASSGQVKSIKLEDVVASNPARPSIRMVYNTSLILEGRNIQRFLAMDEGFLEVKTMDRNQINVKALRYGGTFLNIWDDSGRRTIYVGIVFPETQNSSQAVNLSKTEQHEKPFKFYYSNDWNTYYYGQKGSAFKRQSYDFVQSFLLVGQSPYGYFDTSMNTDDFNSRSSVTSYTVGLTDIPVEGTSHLSLRGFDASRYLSPLTLPNTRLRGVFGDVNLLDDQLGVSYSNGEKRPYFVFLTQNGSANTSSYINAFKLTLNPKDLNNQVSINAAEGYGSEHEADLAKKVYSVEAHKKILDVFLNGEYAKANDKSASLAGARIQEGVFASALNFRQINKAFTTVSGLPSNQGEIGGTWTNSIDAEKISAQTLVDVYRGYLYFNPNNPDALNTNASGSLRFPLLNDFWSDTSAYYVHTPGEVSPRRNINLNQRISKAINLFGLKNTNVYVGGALQRTRYEFSKESAYDRSSVLAGIQIPLTSHLSVYANYDYSWVHELLSNRDINPSVFNTGFDYSRQLTSKLSGNFDMSYRKEMGAQGTTSYLSGEDSAGISLGFSYNPVNDVSFFIDGRARKVWPLIDGNLPYNDFTIRLGLRMSFDILSRGWDPRATISGHVYKDKEGDGHFGPGDEGMAGVKVRVGDHQ